MLVCKLPMRRRCDGRSAAGPWHTVCSCVNQKHMPPNNLPQSGAAICRNTLHVLFFAPWSRERVYLYTSPVWFQQDNSNTIAMLVQPSMKGANEIKEFQSRAAEAAGRLPGRPTTEQAIFNMTAKARTGHPAEVPHNIHRGLGFICVFPFHLPLRRGQSHGQPPPPGGKQSQSWQPCTAGEKLGVRFGI
jgi:hypothetical protein